MMIKKWTKKASMYVFIKIKKFPIAAAAAGKWTISFSHEEEEAKNF